MTQHIDDDPNVTPADRPRVVLVGGHGRTALILAGMLTTRGYRVVSTVRSPAQEPDVRAQGAEAYVLELLGVTAERIQPLLTGAAAVIYAAGAGYGSTSAAKTAIDRDAAIATADAAERAGARRFIMISSMGANLPELHGDDPFGTYLRLKGEADADLRRRDLDWTIVRPSGLTDGAPTHRITVASELQGGSLPRGDLAALIVRLIDESAAQRQTLDVTSGPHEISAVQF